MRSRYFSMKLPAIALTCSILLGLGASNVVADNKLTTPDGFDKLVLYMGTGIFDPTVTEPRPGVTGCAGLFCDGEFFQKTVMGRTDEEIYALKMEAITYYIEQFGLDIDDPALAGRIELSMFTVNPDFEYRVHALSGMKAPAEGWMIRDGGFQLSVIDPNGVDLGGKTIGMHAPQGAAMFFGNYNILVTGKNGKPKDEIIISYKSSVPGELLPNGSFVFRCDMYHEEWGPGVGMGMILFTPLEDGTIRGNGRNVLTFPPTSSVIDFPEFPLIGASAFNGENEDHDDDDDD